jgi:hypothetical protein
LIISGGRPGRISRMAAHFRPFSAKVIMRARSSSIVQVALVISGSKFVAHRSLNCLACRPLQTCRTRFRNVVRDFQGISVF